LVLGVVNFAGFFPLLFFAAYRLPGGVAATLATIQPLLVAGLAWRVLRTRTSTPQLLAALAGVAGVALMTLTAQARLDPGAVVAMLGAVGLMSLGIVLGKRWGSPGTALMSTAWQMTLGGLVLAPSTLGFEGLPEVLTLQNVAGFGYLATLGGAFAYILWFRGIERLSPTSASLLTLASPLTATLAGLIILGQTLTAFQVVGLAVALSAMVIGQAFGAAGRASRMPSRHRLDGTLDNLSSRSFAEVHRRRPARRFLGWCRRPCEPTSRP
jgi:probable blue pigment (indigoidine) exporter